MTTISRRFRGTTIRIQQTKNGKMAFGLDALAKGYGVTKEAIRTHLRRHDREFVGSQSKRSGVFPLAEAIKLGFFIRGPRAKEFRHWLESKYQSELAGAVSSAGATPQPSVVVKSESTFNRAFDLIDSLVAQGSMTQATGLAHKTRLLKEMGGWDLTKAPYAKFENVPVATTKEVESAGEMGRTVIDQIDMTGFFKAHEIAKEFGYSRTEVVGVVARHMGILAAIQEGDITIGKLVPVYVGGVFKNAYPVYTQYAKQVLANVLQNKEEVKKLMAEERMAKEAKKQAGKASESIAAAPTN